MLKWYLGFRVADSSAMHCSDTGSSRLSGSGSFDPVRIEEGQVLVMRISAVLAPWRDLASPSV